MLGLGLGLGPTGLGLGLEPSGLGLGLGLSGLDYITENYKQKIMITIVVVAAAAVCLFVCFIAFLLAFRSFVGLFVCL